MKKDLVYRTCSMHVIDVNIKKKYNRKTGKWKTGRRWKENVNSVRKEYGVEIHFAKGRLS
jgi:hypothetical protein